MYGTIRITISHFKKKTQTDQNISILNHPPMYPLLSTPLFLTYISMLVYLSNLSILLSIPSLYSSTHPHFLTIHSHSHSTHVHKFAQSSSKIWYVFCKIVSITRTCHPASAILGPVLAPISVGPNTMERLLPFMRFAPDR